MTDKVLLVEQPEEGICTLTLNRPEVHNAFDDHLIEHLTQTLKEIDQDKKTLVVILAANGKNFSAGADLAWMQRMIHYSEKENLDDSLKLSELMKTLYHLSKPTIALAQGATFGGGIGLLACCDMVIATHSSSFCFSEVKLGIVPAVISPYVIAAIGKRAAQRYFMTAERFNAEEAYHIHLITEISEEAALQERGIALAERLKKYSPSALTECKTLINFVAHNEMNDELMQELAKRIAHIRVSNSGQEGLNAFLEKRPANWNKEAKS